MFVSILGLLALSVFAQSSPQGMRFVPLHSCRLGDITLGQGETRNFAVRASACGVPANATAYSLNVVAVPQSSTLGYLTVHPAGRPRPVASTLNSWNGRVVSNGTIVEAGTNGDVSVFASDPALVIAEINGYFVPRTSAGGLSFYSLLPCRVADTRTQPPAVAGPFERTFRVRNVCEVPPHAIAYSFNVTVIPDNTALLATTLYPTGATRPAPTTVITIDRQVAANAAIVRGGIDGQVSMYGLDGHDVVLDINGYFAPSGDFGALQYLPVTPCRVADTRATTPIAGGGDRAFEVAGRCGVAAEARSLVLNATVVPPGSLGYLTLWPAYLPQPFTSTLNSFNGQVVANMAVTPRGLNGAVAAYASDATHLVLDVSGYFLPDR